MAGIVITILLSYTGCRKSTNQVDSADLHSVDQNSEEHAEHDHSDPNHTHASNNLDLRVEAALENISKGKETGDMSLVMGKGIRELLAVVKEDSNNLKSIYHLGLFSIESGQLEKAEKRFEKLILLQPENQEYQKTLSDIRQKLIK